MWSCAFLVLREISPQQSGDCQWWDFWFKSLYKADETIVTDEFQNLCLLDKLSLNRYCLAYPHQIFRIMDSIKENLV